MSSNKVLIITYYWPPAGGPGVQRWLKFVKYLPEYNIEPIVFCPKNASYPIIDKSLDNEVSQEIKVVKYPINEPYKWAKLLSRRHTKTMSTGIIPEQKKQSIIQKLLLYIRGNFFIPDARKSWVNPSISYLINIIKKENIDTVITTGPPHSIHLIGYGLNQKLQLKWISDFRDPWTTIGYHKDLKLTTSSKKKHKRLEQKVLNTSDHIIVTSERTKTEFATKTKMPISVITNGYDNHDVLVNKKDKQFTIAHIGSLLSERNPLVLWQCLKELTLEDSSFKEKLQINLVGVVSDRVVASLTDYKLHSYVNLIGYVNHDTAIKYQLKSQLLLLIEIDSEDTKAIIPGKLFEYITSNTPILAIGPKNADIKAIIDQTNTGHYFTHQQKNGLKQQIKRYYESYKQGELKASPIEIRKYSRKALTQQLSKIILK